MSEDREEIEKGKKKKNPEQDSYITKGGKRKNDCEGTEKKRSSI